MTARRILVTGVSSGFGHLTCLRLLERGHHVLGSMRDVKGRNSGAADVLRKAAEASPGRLDLLELDVTDDASVLRAMEEATRLTDGIDVLINNAGIGQLGICEGYTPEQVSRIFDTNVVGAHRMNRAVLPGMRARGEGLIVFAGSIMGRIIVPFSAPYTATKFAVEAMGEGLAYELAGTGIDVVILQPGGFPTEILDKMEGPADEARLATCGDLGERNDQLWKMWFGMLAEAAPDVGLVADGLVELVETPSGRRPLRLIIDPVTGGDAARTLNEAAMKVQRELLDGIGYGDMFRS